MSSNQPFQFTPIRPADCIISEQTVLLGWFPQQLGNGIAPGLSSTNWVQLDGSHSYAYPLTGLGLAEEEPFHTYSPLLSLYMDTNT